MSVENIHLIWLQGQGCTGDTVALTHSSHPDLVGVLTGILPEVSGITLDYHPTVMPSWGKDAVEVLERAATGELDPYILILEGAIPDESKAKETGGFWCVVGEKEGKIYTVNHWIDTLAKDAVAVVAAGTCASYGGIPRGNPNPTGAKGLLDYLGRKWRSKLNLPVICAAGCPVSGQNLVEILVHLVLTVRGVLPPPELDEYHRPKFIYGYKVHRICPRAGFFAHGDDSEDFGEPYCMGLLGCKGPIAHCNVPARGFNSGVGGCTTVGAICIGCTEPEFPDHPFSPFLAKAPAEVYVKDTIKELIGHIRAGLHRLKRREI